MLNKVKTLVGFKLQSLDGEIGTVDGFYFDDHHWTVRYLIANTGNWLMGRQVLISPYALTAVNKEEQYFTLNLTQQQIEDSPSLEKDELISRQFEESYSGYYGWPMYWYGSSMWGDTPGIERDSVETTKFNPDVKAWYHNLRSTSAVRGYKIEASDGEIGHVDDFIMDDETWTIRYLVIDSGNWWSGKKVLLSPQWIERVSWDLSEVFVNLPRESIKQAPEYTEDSPLTRDYEIGLHLHYTRDGYWADERALKVPVSLK